MKSEDNQDGKEYLKYAKKEEHERTIPADETSIGDRVNKEKRINHQRTREQKGREI